MKRFLLLALIASIVACNDQAKNNTEGTDTLIKEQKNDTKDTSGIVDPTPWKINSTTADRMKKYLRGCTKNCIDNSTIVNYNKPVYDAIQAKYPHSKIVAVTARYDILDEFRYCALRKLYNNPDYCTVGKHKTTIYMVAKDSTNKLTEDEFYDFVTICPPPRECNRDSIQ